MSAFELSYLIVRRMISGFSVSSSDNEYTKAVSMHASFNNLYFMGEFEEATTLDEANVT